mmetsp:Transcript_10240/g.30090  ORF Transcript_10240/g.30090 Transcript_10240/m.30090 type:complete len:290 (-) Transcript_10240:58-927(-)
MTSNSSRASSSARSRASSASSMHVWGPLAGASPNTWVEEPSILCITFSISMKSALSFDWRSPKGSFPGSLQAWIHSRIRSTCLSHSFSAAASSASVPSSKWSSKGWAPGFDGTGSSSCGTGSSFLTVVLNSSMPSSGCAIFFFAFFALSRFFLRRRFSRCDLRAAFLTVLLISSLPSVMFLYRDWSLAIRSSNASMSAFLLAIFIVRLPTSRRVFSNPCGIPPVSIASGRSHAAGASSPLKSCCASAYSFWASPYKAATSSWRQDGESGARGEATQAMGFTCLARPSVL